MVRVVTYSDLVVFVRLQVPRQNKLRIFAAHHGRVHDVIAVHVQSAPINAVVLRSAKSGGGSIPLTTLELKFN